MSAVFTIARNTFTEIIRDRILYAILVFGFLFILLSLLLGNLSFSEQGRIVTNLGLAAAHLLSVVVAVFLGSTLVSREIEKQTILTLISRPISRTTFLVGKFVGLSFVVALVLGLISIFLGVLLYVYGEFPFQLYLTACFGIFLEALVLISFSILFGTLTKPLLTVVFTTCIWMIGHGVEDIAYFSGKSEILLVKKAGEVLDRVLPHFENFNFRNHVVYLETVGGSTLLQAISIAAGWILLTQVLASLIFKKRDFI